MYNETVHLKTPPQFVLWLCQVGAVDGHRELHEVQTGAVVLIKHPEINSVLLLYGELQIESLFLTYLLI